MVRTSGAGHQAISTARLLCVCSGAVEEIVMPGPDWVDIGSTAELSAQPLRRIKIGARELAVSFSDGRFGVVSNTCNHVGGPLGEGHLDGDYIVCPWHNWKFHRCSGLGEPGFEEDAVPAYAVKVADGRVLIDIASATKRTRKPHDPHPLSRKIERAPGPLRLAGISTTAMDEANPRFSGSDHLLNHAIRAAATQGAEGRLIRLSALKFRACEGYYSKSARACTWPCSITQMDSGDQMDQVYEALVHWADVVIVASPIRWGAASSLYYKMAERLNCVQNAVTIRNQVLIRNKVAGFIIVGGQDNIQGVAGQALGFFAELGFIFPQFPYIAHSRGWSAEDMEHNVEVVKESKELAEGAGMLVKRCLDLAGQLLARDEAPTSIERGGRKAHDLRMEMRLPTATDAR
jgi:nitrite reductase/ring-hydroxylating ferredoxin subunit/multimeric flavodoxin WrbA